MVDQTANERDMLCEMLDSQRDSVVRKASGISTAQAVDALLTPSTLTIGGLVKHLTGVERFWFSIDFANADLDHPWTYENPHGNMIVGPDETIEQLIADYLGECERSRLVVADAKLDELAHADDMHFTLRYALLHMIEETARHCGHLDLLREHTDGLLGQ